MQYLIYFKYLESTYYIPGIVLYSGGETILGFLSFIFSLKQEKKVAKYKDLFQRRGPRGGWKAQALTLGPWGVFSCTEQTHKLMKWEATEPRTRRS